MPLLYYITDRRQFAADSASQDRALKDNARRAFAAGIDYVQVREKDLEAGVLAVLVEELLAVRAATVKEDPRRRRLLVNDRLDIARACGSDGVHLPANSLPIAAARKLVGPDWIVGAACHTIEEVEQAARDGADHVLVAPVFDTASKPGIRPMGLERFSEICGRSPVPVFALGGISVENAQSCIDAGAKGLAGIRLFQQSSDLSDLCRRLRAL